MAGRPAARRPGPAGPAAGAGAGAGVGAGFGFGVGVGVAPPPGARRAAALRVLGSPPCPREPSVSSGVRAGAGARRRAAAGAAAGGAGAGAGGGGSGGAPDAAAGAPAWLSFLTDAFPVWVLLGSALALLRPALFAWVSPRLLVLLLSSTMLGMGLTLTLREVADALRRVREVSAGCLLQYSVMPLLGFAASRLSGLPPALAAGVVLVSCCPGGTASNIVSYMARADVPLSVLMTSVSTVGAVVMTPLLTKALLAGTSVPVNGAAMLASTAQVVLVPVLLGSALNSRFPRSVARVSTYTPAAAVLMVALVCAATVSRSVTSLGAGGGGMGLREVAPALFGALLLLHAGGFFLGYAISRAAGFRERVCRTNSIEVGMQNSTLGAALAALHFADPAVAAPAAISACMHSCLGSLLAAFWRRRDRARGEA